MRVLKALSVVEPWGEFIAAGKKTIEVRSWTTRDLLPDEDLLIVQNKKRLHAGDAPDPDGKAMALVRVLEMRPFVYADRAHAKTERFEEGLFAWVLGDLRPLKKRVRVVADRKIYQVTLNEADLE
jgi:hypothetical protein